MSDNIWRDRAFTVPQIIEHTARGWLPGAPKTPSKCPRRINFQQRHGMDTRISAGTTSLESLGPSSKWNSQLSASPMQDLWLRVGCWLSAWSNGPLFGAAQLVWRSVSWAPSRHSRSELDRCLFEEDLSQRRSREKGKTWSQRSHRKSRGTGTRTQIISQQLVSSQLKTQLVSVYCPDGVGAPTGRSGIVR